MMASGDTANVPRTHRRELTVVPHWDHAVLSAMVGDHLKIA